MYFFVGVAVVFVYIAAGNYAYFCKVLPTLKRHGADDTYKFWRSELREQFARATDILRLQGKKPGLVGLFRPGSLFEIGVLVIMVLSVILQVWPQNW